MKRAAYMTDEELEAEIARCDHRAVSFGETAGGAWATAAKHYRMVLRNRKREAKRVAQAARLQKAERT